ncbi:oxidoreductase [Aureococcus anophagefferens]|nr:oxidoreductase [Aureococcus anophagefferens]
MGKGSGEAPVGATMKTNRAGGLELSALGYGTWQFGSGGADDYWGLEFTDDMAVALLKQATAAGVTYVDTAADYAQGGSELQLGRALKALAPDARAKVVIGSKILPNNCGERAFLDLMELQKEGKIKHIGVSNFGVRQLADALETGVTIAVNQLAYNLLTRAIEFEILPFCRQRGIGVLAYSPLLQGVLTGAFPTIADIPPYRARTRHFSGARDKSRHGEAGHEVLLAATLEKLRAIAKASGIALADLAVAWPLAKGAACVVAGAMKAHQLEANVKAANLDLPPALVAELDAATDELKQAMGANADGGRHADGTDDGRIR